MRSLPRFLVRSIDAREPQENSSGGDFPPGFEAMSAVALTYRKTVLKMKEEKD